MKANNMSILNETIKKMEIYFNDDNVKIFGECITGYKSRVFSIGVIENLICRKYILNAENIEIDGQELFKNIAIKLVEDEVDELITFNSKMLNIKSFIEEYELEEEMIILDKLIVSIAADNNGGEPYYFDISNNTNIRISESERFINIDILDINNDYDTILIDKIEKCISCVYIA